VTENLPEPLNQQIEEGVDILKQGGIIAFPTDTVYGLGASVFSKDTIRRIFKVKQRPFNMALPVLIAGIDQLKEVAAPMPEVATCLAQNFWPGALTLVLLKSKRVPNIVTANEKTIAVRIPAHPVPLALINRLGAPIIGTSANVHGKPSPVTAAEVRAQLGDKVDLIIDGGRCPDGEASTIVDVTGEIPVLLREGPVSFNEIMRVCKIK
jgi:L-threonylcarbamoyladenylate synthase